MPFYDAGVSSLTPGVTVLNADGTVHVARSTAGITEPVAGSGVYYVADHDTTIHLEYLWDNGTAGTICASETLAAGRGVGDAYAEAALVHAHVATIEADTNELQVELADGGRTDLILDAIGTSIIESAPENMTADSGSLVTGTNVSGDYTATYLDNATFWTTAPVTPAVEGFGLSETLTFLCGHKRASQIIIVGRYNGTGRYANVYAWNYDTGVWDQLSDSITCMLSRSSDATYTFRLLNEHQKNVTAGDGEVKIRFASPSTTTADRLYIDQALIEALAVGATTSDIANAVALKLAAHLYDGGVTIDTISGTAGTAIGTNGTPTNPVLGIDDALTIAAELGVKRLYMRPDSDITLTHEGNFDYWRFIGKGLVHLNDASINDSRFENCELVDGVSTGSDMDFQDCNVGDITVDSCVMRDCLLTGTFTTVASGLYTLIGCADGLPGTGNNPDIVFAANVGFAARYWSGGIELKGVSLGCYVAIGGLGRVVINADCTGGQIIVRGNIDLTDQGGVPGTFDALADGSLVDTARWNEDQTMTAIEADTSAILAALPTTSYRFLIKT